MRPSPSSIRLAVCAALGVVAVAPAAQAAPVLPNGVYQATINVTPTQVVAGSTFIVPGTDGAWNSTFSFNSTPKAAKSQGMTDNATDITISGTSYGSSKAGDGAGSWDMTVNNGNWTASNFQVDSIAGTAGGTFVQYGSIVGGTVDQTTGAMTLDPTGRMGAIPTVPGAKWNIPSGGTNYAQFTTGSQTNASGTIGGHDIVSNGDGTYNVILVSASNVGDAWGSSFASVPYMETWNVNLAPVPIPAAAWLFGSGLIGLVGIARRKKSS